MSGRSAAGTMTAVAIVAVFGIVMLLGYALATSLWDSVAADVQVLQRDLHRQLSAAMRAVERDGATAALGLITLGFFYGIFHAAGPGHGKFILSTYLATHESALGRGVALSVISSLAQAVTAILLVEVTVALLGLPFRQASDAATTLENFSYAMIVLMGLVIIVASIRRIVEQWRHGHHDHAHHDDHAGHDHHDHGHSHGPSAAQMEKQVSLKGLAGIVLSIGIRPCSGAILVLLAAHALGLRWAGIAATFAIAAGTALTVTVIAVLSVYARKGLLRLAAGRAGDGAQVAYALHAVALIGGLILLAGGMLLLQAALSAPKHPLM